MSEYTKACALSDIPEGGVLAVTVGDLALALVRDGETVYAIKDACSHADVALSEGEVSGCTLECWLHGSEFDLRTGEPLSPPATAAVPIFQTKVRNDDGEAVVEVCTTAMTPHEISDRNNQPAKDAS
jgi:3-phenylpropionate/trans-cinnamate dioxygenase ferredoxin component